MDDLSIALVQANLTWEDASANRAMLDDILEEMNGKTDLVILPEMFTTGFSMNSERLAEEMHGETISWMRAKADVLDTVVTGSLIIKKEGRFYNRLVWMRPGGTFEIYDKRHLFSMGKEDEYYAPGTRKLIVGLKGWRICPLICYDLRFPVWSRNRNDTDMLIYVANWPSSRRHIWNILLRARAIENQVFVAGVNRVGSDGEGIEYQGDSQLINPKGEIIASFDLSYPGITITKISPDDLLPFRKKFPVGKDADNFTLHI